MQRLLTSYKAAIFDLDGTLVDSMGLWDKLCRDWLSSKGIIAADTLEQDLACMTLSQSAEYVISRYNLKLSAVQVIQAWENLVLYCYEHTVPLKEGAAELVKGLGAMKLGIATSCFPAACEAVLSRHGIRDYFSVILYADQVSRDKTFPDLYLACAEQLQVNPRDCVVFEDFWAALSGVRAAGMGMAAVYDEYYAAQWEGFKEKADYAVVSFRELLDLGKRDNPLGATRGTNFL